MADTSDVEVQLVNAVSSALYPNGTNAASVPGTECRIYRGWPTSAALDADLAAGRINVTIFPVGPGRTTTRYSEQWSGTPVQPSLIATAAGPSVTFAGTANPGQIAGILVNGQGYAYRIQPGDTPELVAANLAGLARSNCIVGLAGSTLTFAGTNDPQARVVADAPVQREMRRQVMDFRVTCWCPTPATRDAAAAAIDGTLSSTRFITLADGTSGRLVYAGTTLFDQSQNARLYRRDLSYSVEYPTILSSLLPSMLFGDLVLNASAIAV